MTERSRRPEQVRPPNEHRGERTFVYDISSPSSFRYPNTTWSISESLTVVVELLREGPR
jgi:hypothetical protein